jgi:hypothetical protein
MKKFLLLLGFVLLAAVTIPQANAMDADVGYQIVLPADHNAVVTADCQAVVTAPEMVYQVAVRDPGDRPVELRAQSSGLREESPAKFSSLYQGDVTYNNFFRNQQCTRLYMMNNRQRVTPSVRSTSCGGIGY